MFHEIPDNLPERKRDRQWVLNLAENTIEFGQQHLEQWEGVYMKIYLEEKILYYGFML